MSKQNGVFCVTSVCAGLTWGSCHPGSGHRSGQGLRGCLSHTQATGAWAAHWEWRLCTSAVHTRLPAQATACVPPGVWPGLWTFSSIPGGLSVGTTALVDTELGSKALGLPFCFSLEGWLILGPSGTCLSVPETSGYRCLGHRRSLWSPFS